MLRVFSFGMTLFLMAPVFVLGQNKGKNGNIIDGTPAEYVQLNKVSDVVGKLASVEQGSAAKSFALDIQYFYPAPGNYKGPAFQRIPGGGFRPLAGANYANQLNNLLTKQQQLLQNPTKKNLQKAMQLAGQIQNLQVKVLMQQMQQMMTMNRLFNQAAAAAANATKLASGFKEFNMEMIDNVVVRRLNPPFEYDDKGNVKKYTKDELDKLKGKDKNLVGYEAKVEDLQAGQVVKVYLVKPKAKPKDDPKADKNDNVDKEKKAEDPQPDPPQARMILILADVDANAPDNPAPKKKKKQ